MTVRELVENQEKNFSKHARLSSKSRGRLHIEQECPVRTVYQRDRDRILHAQSFRLLKHKTNVFLSTTGEKFRTRLTHTLEVSSIARTIAQALRLNSDLAEAISLGHDLGHTPFGHAGESILQKIDSSFHHATQSLRVVDYIEKEGKGLNLTHEVRDGILKHTKGKKKISEFDGNGLYGKPNTLEGQVVQYSDWIAYINHDLDDAFRMGLITEMDIPREVPVALGSRHSERINTMVQDIVSNSEDKENLSMSKGVLHATEVLRDFLYSKVYTKPQVFGEEIMAESILMFLYEYFERDPKIIYNEYTWFPRTEVTVRNVLDYLSGLTDAAAIELYKNLN